MNNATEATEQTYRIGAVARLTGISTEALRMWERRYGVVEPSRSDGRNRLYTHDDIGRLALLKRLVDAGESIGTIAHLPLEQLQERIALHRTQQSIADDRTDVETVCRVAILGDALPALFGDQSSGLRGIELVAMHRDPQLFEATLETLRPDLIIIEYPTVHHETAAKMNALLARSGAKRALVIYGFGATRAVRQLDTAQITPLRAPVGLPELRTAILAGNTMPVSGVTVRETALDGNLPDSIPPRRFDHETLARLATVSTTVHCECPHHLVELIRSLTAFETYSTECKNLSHKDAALHALLEATTARARSLMENALALVVEAEGLEDLI